MRQQFLPGPLGIFVNPGYISRRGLQLAIAKYAPQFKGRLLDLGCGRKPYRPLFANVSEYVGVDVEVSGHETKRMEVDVYYDGKTLPFPDDHFDGIFSSEVFEHVFNLPAILNELHRVLRPGGIMLITVPFAVEEHEVPYDFGRYSSFGLKHILETAGFEIRIQEKRGTFIAALTQYVVSYLARRWPLSKSTAVRLIVTPILFAPINAIGMLFAAILPKDQSLFISNVVVASKPG
ncbi:MAG: methyltransferase domain-containing protein [Rhizomicrobium sp.]